MSEVTDRIRGTIDEATRVFGDADAASRWLNTRNVALGDQRPLDLLSSHEGELQVLHELSAIEHGLPV